MRQDCMNVRIRGSKDIVNSWKPFDVPIQIENNTTGITAASPTAIGGRLGLPSNKWRADAVSEKVNQTAINPAVSFP